MYAHMLGGIFHAPTPATTTVRVTYTVGWPAWPVGAGTAGAGVTGGMKAKPWLAQ